MRNSGKIIVLILCLLVFISNPALAQESNTGQPVLSLDAGDVLSLIVGLVGLVAGIIGVLVAALRGGQSADAGAAAEFEKRQRDREWMERNERAYQMASAERKELFNLMTNMFGFIAPMTPFKFDDAGVRMLRDIQSPGAPADLPPAPVPAPTTTPAGELPG